MVIWAQTRPGRTPREPDPPPGWRMARLKGDYIERIDEIVRLADAGEIDARRAHQELSVALRQFVQEASGISAPTMTLSELGHSRNPVLGPVTEIVRGIYPVEFGPDRHASVFQAGDVCASGGGASGPDLAGDGPGPVPGRHAEPAVARPAGPRRGHRGRPGGVARAPPSRRAGPRGAGANTELLRTLPEYHRAVRRQRWLVAGGVALVGLLAVAAVLGAARPVQRVTLVDQKDNRDIVLCLDVSGSMIDVDAEVVSTFLRLADGFRGERISMVIFNSSAVPVFPLTDDYDFVSDQLRRAQRSLTIGRRQGPVLRRHPQRRGQLAHRRRPRHLRPQLRPPRAPARPVGHPRLRQRGRGPVAVHACRRAASWPRPAGIQVYGMNPSDNPSSSAAVEMRQVVEATGGIYFALNDDERRPPHARGGDVAGGHPHPQRAAHGHPRRPRRPDRPGGARRPGLPRHRRIRWRR